MRDNGAGWLVALIIVAFAVVIALVICMGTWEHRNRGACAEAAFPYQYVEVDRQCFTRRGADLYCVDTPRHHECRTEDDDG
jgi:hypothetical protein